MILIESVEMILKPQMSFKALVLSNKPRVVLFLKNSQSNGEDVFNKSIFGRAKSVVGDITKGFFKDFFSDKFEKDIVSNENVSFEQPMLENMLEENNVDNLIELNNVSKGVTAKKVLKGMVGVVLALPFLACMGTLYIANIVRFAVKNEEDIYVYELNKLFQSNNSNDRKRAIFYLNEMISKHKEGSVEYNATVRFLNENTEIFKLCLESKDCKLFDGTTKFLTEVSKNKCEKTKHDVKSIIVNCLNSTDNIKNGNATKILTEMLKNENNNTKSFGCGIIKLEGVSEIIQRFLGSESESDDLKSNTIYLLTEMLKNNETQATAEGIVKGCIKSDNAQSMINTIGLLTALSKDKNIQTTVVQIVKNCLGQEDSKLRSNAIKLLTNMLKSENTNIENFVKEFFKEENIDLDDESEVFTGKIEGWLVSNDDQLKANTIALLTEMLKNKNTRADAERFIGKFSEKIGDWLESDNV